MSEYPEHDKLSEIADESQAIGEFMEWLEEVKNITLCDDCEHSVRTPITVLLAEYYEIDLDKLEEEKRAMLAALREANQ